MITRRSMLFGLLAAPAIIRTPGLLMPVKRVDWPTPGEHMLLPPGEYPATLVHANFEEVERRIHMVFNVSGNRYKWSIA